MWRLIAISIIFMIAFVAVALFITDWKNGKSTICPNDGTVCDLVAVDCGFEYYQCPECGKIFSFR